MPAPLAGLLTAALLLLPSLEMARQFEKAHPEVSVTFLPMFAEAGKSLALGVSPLVAPSTGKLFEPGFNEAFVDTASGEERGKRELRAVGRITRENLVSLL